MSNSNSSHTFGTLYEVSVFQGSAFVPILFAICNYNLTRFHTERRFYLFADHSFTLCKGNTFKDIKEIVLKSVIKQFALSKFVHDDCFKDIIKM